MIRPAYALKLARTKLRSKRSVLITSIVVASLLFAALIATAIVFTGAEKSALEFIRKAGNDQYLVRSQPNIPYEKLSFNLTPPLDEIRKIKAFEKQYYQDLREKHKSLNLEYNEEVEVPALEPHAFADKALPEEQRVKVNFSSPVIQTMNEQRFKEYLRTATNKIGDLRRIGSRYGASGYYIVNQPSLLPTIPQMRLIQDGKEDFSNSDPKTGGDFTSYGYYTHSVRNSMYDFTDQVNTTRYLLPTDTTALKGVPVIVSTQEAASLFGKNIGIGEEPNNERDKKEWLKIIQEKLKGQTYQVCYRNGAEQLMLDKIQRDYAEMKNNENNKEYQKPALIYEHPEEACGEIAIKEDTRTAADKKADSKAEEVQKKLGTYTAPTHRLLTFQVVGVKYAQPFLDHTKSVNEYVKSLLVSQGDTSNTEIPIQIYNSLPDRLKLDDIREQEGAGTVVQQASANDEFAARVLEFSSIEDARNFINNEACSSAQNGCDKDFIASPYGSNYLILDEIGTLFTRISRIAFPVALGLAVVTIWFTISRIMTESRKETAVYRAMGAKRRDITAIYVTYALLVASQIMLVSVALGVGVAFAIDHFYGQILTDTAVAAFGIVDGAPKFSLFSIESPLLLAIVGAILIVSIAASIQPLVRNVRRSPIRDMRDEG